MTATRSMCKLGAFVLAVLQVGACTGPDHAELRGSLYFAAGNYLAMLDLRDGSTSVVTNLGDVDIRSMSPQREGRLLLSVIGTDDNRETRHLVLYDLKSRQTLTLLNGRDGHYLPGTNTLVYDDGVRIQLTERVRGSWEKTEVATHRYNQGVVIVPVSATRFIYRLGDGPPLVYDKETGQSSGLDELAAVCRLDRALWFVRREQMLCQVERDGPAFTYGFAGLGGTLHETLPLPGGHDLRPLVYLPDQATLVLTERWRGQLAGRVKWAVWVYLFETGESYRLLDDQHLGDSVMYAPD